MTKEDVIRMAREARMPYFYQTKEIANLNGLERFAALVASAERERIKQANARRFCEYEDIKDFCQRCHKHPEHQSGMISNSMIQKRLQEEIDELREYIEAKLKERNNG